MCVCVSSLRLCRDKKQSVQDTKWEILIGSIKTSLLQVCSNKRKIKLNSKSKVTSITLFPERKRYVCIVYCFRGFLIFFSLLKTFFFSLVFIYFEFFFFFFLLRIFFIFIFNFLEGEGGFFATEGHLGESG